MNSNICTGKEIIKEQIKVTSDKKKKRRLALAFDTSNETIAIGVADLDSSARYMQIIDTIQQTAHRSSNTKLLPLLDSLFKKHSLEKADISCVCVGAGPGSFTGVRIAMSTAKGLASATGCALVPASTLEAVAQGVWLKGYRGCLLVLADAMRKEVYPAYFSLSEEGVFRLTPDCVVKATGFTFDLEVFGEASTRSESSRHVREKSADTECDTEKQCANTPLYITGDALCKYRGLFAEKAQNENVAVEILPERTWQPSPEGLLAVLQHIWQAGDDILDEHAFSPMRALPVYTRLSDAEENERARLADRTPKNLISGVQGSPAQAHDNTAKENATDAGLFKESSREICVTLSPFSASFVDDACAIENEAMGSDAWTALMIEDDLHQNSRTWWMAVNEGVLVGYAGAMLAGDELQLLKVAVVPNFQRQGVASALMQKLAEDGRNLAANTMSLEVRSSNAGAIHFYKELGFTERGIRKRYYSDGEDAVIMSCDIAKLCKCFDGNVALQQKPVPGACSHSTVNVPETSRPLILAIETSCDETAAAVVDGKSHVLSNIVASQIDFHARFGGVVPEIASRKHVEAIAGVAEAALADVNLTELCQKADGNLSEPTSMKPDCILTCSGITWRDLDAIAVTYAPGLVGALVVGVAFAKGAGWALDIPVVGVNHLEGHLYANKLSEGFAPPAVVSLVSGGNTMLVHMRDWQNYKILGETIDDAVGEAFDKVAKALGLPYPGGPQISKLAEQGNPDAIDFPRALLHSGDYNFSLSGLKTAVSVYIEKARDINGEISHSQTADICASFQKAVIDVQVAKASRALQETEAPCFCVGGGVAANAELRHAYELMCEKQGVKLFMPPLYACGDNAVMIGLVAQDRFAENKFMPLDGDAFAHTNLEEKY